MKEVIITVLLLILLVAGFVVLVNNDYDQTRNYCMEDCNTTGGKFVRYFNGYRSPEQCICEINKEIKNIW